MLTPFFFKKGNPSHEISVIFLKDFGNKIESKIRNFEIIKKNIVVQTDQITENF